MPLFNPFLRVGEGGERRKVKDKPKSGGIACFLRSVLYL